VRLYCFYYFFFFFFFLRIPVSHLNVSRLPRNKSYQIFKFTIAVEQFPLYKVSALQETQKYLMYNLLQAMSYLSLFSVTYIRKNIIINLNAWYILFQIVFVSVCYRYLFVLLARRNSILSFNINCTFCVCLWLPDCRTNL